MVQLYLKVPIIAHVNYTFLNRYLSHLKGIPRGQYLYIVL